MFVVPTISFRLLYGLLVLRHSRRQLVWLGVTAGVTTFKPSIADSTEMAGVMAISPKNNDVPTIPTSKSRDLVRVPTTDRAKTIRAKVPPSPPLFGREEANSVRMLPPQGDQLVSQGDELKLE
jgi:hypothetical protein